ncbi:hypothetical protein EV356DRAFT_533858 [Viridothelium virens]|uniref:Transmembrane protein 135 N-terminal domain-containing protein n=1 Tax=Viridothelium virens TaxID=1048519 RepID=A0A6A6H5T1_VIRVR|nr:hypothetical protein EV356DRAFT_533858 [Viridothelium virens]
MAMSLDRGSNAMATLKPTVLAYLLGYISSTGPKIIKILFQLILQKRSASETVLKIQDVIRQAASFNCFPAFCASTVAGSTILQIPLQRGLRQLAARLRRSGLRFSSAWIQVTAKFLAAFSGTLVGFTLLNSRNVSANGLPRTSNFEKKASASTNKHYLPAVPSNAAGQEKSDPESHASAVPRSAFGQTALAGRSMDITLFTFVRAIDVIFGSQWSKYRRQRTKAGSWTALQAFLAQSIDPTTFVVSCSIIMWSWFYSPDRLPRAYNLWISSAAEVDERLIEALRQVRYGNFVYGKDTGIASLLGSMCKDYDWPVEWGDPAKTIPIPCEMVHMGCGPNCEKHAIARFGRAWYFAARMYFPLNLLMLLRRRNLTTKRVFVTVLDAARSSAFLGAFVSLFYYGVCLSRTRLGPRLFSRKTVTPMQWDGGLCVGAGCLLCGWSILLEKASRRQELASFVAPRALATVFPRRYDKTHQWKEQLLFSVSAAIVLTAAQMRPKLVRGVLGRLLHQVLVSGDHS